MDPGDDIVLVPPAPRECFPSASKCHESGQMESKKKRKKKKKKLQVFWFPTEATPLLQPAKNSIQHKIKSFLVSLKLGLRDCGAISLVQFWAPTTTGSGQKILSVVDQPFGVGENFKGLYRYRYYCVHYEVKYGMTVNRQLGPVGRAFFRGSPEFSQDIDTYSTEEFPFRDYAKYCGIRGYWALPVFQERDDDRRRRSCVGVLEFLSLSTIFFGISPFIEKLKDVGLELRYPLPDSRKLEMYAGANHLGFMLEFVRRMYEPPLIQVWIPCICEGSKVSFTHSSSSSKVTHLFRGLQLFDCNAKSVPFNIWLDPQEYFVEDGKGWVGRAHLQNNICFYKNASQFSIFYYPLLPLIRLSGLTACFAIPMQLIHPQLPLFILEVFLPPVYNSNGSPETILKPLVPNVARELSNSNVDLELARAEDTFLVRSPSGNDDNMVCFDVVRPNGSGKALVKGRDQDVQVLDVEEDYVHRYQTDDAAAINEPASLEAANDHSSIALPEITLTIIEKHFGRNLVDAADELGVSRSTLKRKCRSFGIKRWPSHKRNKVPTKAVLSGAKVSRNGSHNARERNATVPNSTPTSETGTSIGMGDAELDQSYTLVIKATYRDNIVMFPFRSSSGIQDLCCEFKRFKLEVDSFVVKYEDDGDLILISCDEDLRFRMDTLKASGQTIMYLLVLPLKQSF